MAMSDFLANKLLKHLTGESFVPGELHLGLMISATTEVSTSNTGYTRMSLTGKTRITGDALILNEDINFPAAQADYGLVTHISVWDAATDGSMYFVGTLLGVRSISTGEIFDLLADNFSIQLT